MGILKKIELALGVITVLAILALIWRLDHVSQELKITKSKIEELERQNEAIKNEAVKAINRPRTDDDVTSRLCEWAKNQYKHETGKKLQLSNGPCH